MGRVPDEVIQEILNSAEAKRTEAKKLGLTKEEAAQYVAAQFDRKESDMPAWEVFLRRASVPMAAPVPAGLLSQAQQDVAELVGSSYRPDLPPEQFRREERIAQRRAKEETGGLGFASEASGISAGLIGGVETGIAKGVETLGAKAVAKAPSLVQKTERFLAPSAGRLAAGIGGGLISEAQQGTIKSLDDIKEDIKSYGAAGLLFETLILGGKTAKDLAGATARSLSPSLKRIESTVGLKEVKGQKPTQLGLKQETAEQMTVSREPLLEAVNEYADVANGIKSKVEMDLHAIGLESKDALQRVRKQINDRYGETGGKIFKEFGNTPLDSNPIYGRLVDLLQERGVLYRTKSGLYDISEKEANVFGTSWPKIKQLFEDMGGLAPINSDKPMAIKNLTLNQLRNRKTELEDFAKFEAQGKGYAAGVAEQVYGAIDEAMETAYPRLREANEQYAQDITRYKSAYNALKSSDIKYGGKLLKLNNPKNAEAIAAIESLKDISPEFAKLTDRIAEKSIPTKMLNNITKAESQGDLAKAFLNMGQDEFKAVLDASRKFPELLPIARKAKAAAEARQLWLDVKDQAQEIGVLSGMSRGSVPRLKLPDKTIVKMAMMLDSTPESVKFLGKVFPGIPLAVLKSPKPRAAFKIWARTKDGEDIIRDAIESPQWIMENASIPPQLQMTEEKAFEEKIPGLPTGKPRI